MTINLRHTVEPQALDHFVPAHVVVNVEGDVLHHSPHIDKYLDPTAALPSRQLLTMVRRDFRSELESALREAAEHRRPIVRQNINVEGDDRLQRINLSVGPLPVDQREVLY